MQNLVSVSIVIVMSFMGIISTEPLTWRLVKVWLPVNIIFVGMLITSIFRYDLSFPYCLITEFKYVFSERKFRKF